MTWLVLRVAALVVWPALAIAQDATANAAPISDVAWYTSEIGIAGLTVAGVAFLKRALARVTWVNQVPTWAYAMVVGLTLTAIAAYGYGTMPTGWQGLVQGAQNAVMASGGYAMARAATTTLQESATSDRRQRTADKRADRKPKKSAA